MTDQPVIVNFPAGEVVAAAEAAHQLLEFRHVTLGHRVADEEAASSYRRCVRCRVQWDSLLTLINQGEHLRPQCTRCSHLYVEHGSGHDGCQYASCDCPFSRDLMIPLARLADLYNSLGYQQAIADKRET